MGKNKVIVIGIDGAPYQKLKEWELPFLSSIGPLQRLESIIPTLSCPSWPCIYTGLTPKQLGFYDFVDFNDGSLINSNRWWDKSLFNQEGKRQILLNLPISYPVHKVDGILLTGLNTPPSARVWTYPAMFSNTFCNYEPSPLIDISIPDNEEEIKTHLQSLIEKRFRVAKFILEKEKDWDLFWFVIYELDPLMHYFWKYIEMGSQYSKLIETYFRDVDQMLGDLLKDYTDAKIFVVSDHGFGPYKKGFNINGWLEKEGYLVLKKEHKPNLVEYIVETLPIVKKLEKLVPKSFIEKHGTAAATKDMVLDLYQMIDWERTTAFSPGMVSGMIFTKSLGKEIKEQLETLSLNVLHTKDNLEIRGFIGNLQILGDGTGLYPMNRWKKDIWLDNTWSGSHTLDGIFITNQKGYNKDLKVTDIRQIIEKEILEK